MQSTPFSRLGLSAPLLRALAARHYSLPTPVQAAAIPELCAGRDLIGIAQTGTGKTAAFALPILQRLAGRPPATPRAPHALVLVPTRELAMQVSASFATYGAFLPLRHAVVFGGVGQEPQVRSLRAGADILVATPGRLLDLLGQRHLVLDRVQVLVLDEADRMLDLGFAPDVARIAARLPAARQSVLFSATMPDEVETLARGLLRDPVRIHVTPPATAVARITQQVCYVEKPHKRAVLGAVLQDPAFGRTLVFARTRHGADRIVKHLHRVAVTAEAIHGDKSQPARTRALEAFRSGRTRVLVATDIAARGIDVAGITHVINFDLPRDPDSYVHRIGRTARAGRDGVALSFCEPEQRAQLAAIERLIRQKVEVVAAPSVVAGAAPVAPQPASDPRPAAAARRPVRRRVRRRRFSGRR